MSSSSDLVPVISYARISSDGERDEHGVGDQHRVNRRTAKRLGLTVVAEMTDNDRSASKAKVVRESFEAMLKALAAGRLPDGTVVRGVVVLNEDRLARRAGDYERFVEALTADDGRVFADERGSKDLYAEDVEGMGLVGVAFSKIESRKMRRRMRRFHRARAEDGKSPGGTRPFGWAPDRIHQDPIEAPLLATAAKDFAAGRSINSIVREWMALGVRTSLGGEWSGRSLRLTLANPRICGWRRLRGEIVKDDAGRPIVGAWEPIVAPDVWLSIDAIVQSRKGRKNGPDGQPGDLLAADFAEHKYLLSGILRCGKPRPDGSICGGPLRARWFGGTNRVFHYVCQPRSAGGCAGICRRGAYCDEYVSEMVLAKLEQRELSIVVDDTWTGAAEMEAAQAQLDALGREWRSGGLSNDFFFRNARELEGMLARLRAAQGRHVARQRRKVIDIEDLRRRWHAPEEQGGLDIGQKRAYIREALHAVIVYPAKVGRAKFNPDLLEPVWRDD
jgi:DNA invertase Pin-like site-specific DNA recombinase